MPMRRIQRLTSVIALFGLVLLSACDLRTPATTTEPSGLTEQQFVTVYVELWRARTAATTPEEYEAQKTQILERAKVSERALQLFAREHADDISFMAAVWDSVQNRLNSPTGAIQPE